MRLGMADYCRFQLEDPNFRNEDELQDIRKFQDAAVLMLDRKDRLVSKAVMLASRKRASHHT